MSSTGYSGSLQNKKKEELQDIAQALRLGDNGTRVELQQRIKKHLEDNANELESDPEFSGLYANVKGKRQRSVQPTERGSSTRARSRSNEPQQQTLNTKIFARADELQSSMSSIAEDEESETSKENRWTPARDIRDVSMMLPHAPLTPVAAPTPRRISVTPPQERRLATSSPRNIPLPPTPAKSVLTESEGSGEIKAHRASGNSIGLLRSALSSGRNIFILTALVDFAQILYAVNKNEATNSFSAIPTNPFASTAAPILGATGLATLCWSVPTLLVPIVFGYLISSSGSGSWAATDPSSVSFDPLSASIVRFAATIALDFPSVVVVGQNDLGTGDVPVTQSLDVVGLKLRAISAGVAVAFAFAEAIQRRI